MADKKSKLEIQDLIIPEVLKEKEDSSLEKCNKLSYSFSNFCRSKKTSFSLPSRSTLLSLSEGTKTRVLENSPLYMIDQDGTDQLKLPHLVCLVGSKNLIGRYWVIENNKSFYIGRTKGCTVFVNEVSVSKKHLKIYIENEQVFGVDQGSTNGTFINNQKILPNKRLALQDNAAIKTGSFIFKFLDKGNYEIFSVRKNLEKISTDPLTGIGNRVMLERKSEESFKLSQEEGKPLSCIILDIDYFKKVNDTYGHVTGDFILKEVVQIVNSCFRAEDIFVRAGGEEFCLIMHSSIKRAKEAIEKGRKRVEDHIFIYKKQELRVTISAGVATYKKSDKKWQQIYERADKFLYKAKATGRNRVVGETE